MLLLLINYKNIIRMLELRQHVYQRRKNIMLAIRSTIEMETMLEYIGDLEDMYMVQQRMEDIKSGKTKTIPFDEIIKDYDLADSDI